MLSKRLVVSFVTKNLGTLKTSYVKIPYVKTPYVKTLHEIQHAPLRTLEFEKKLFSSGNSLLEKTLKAASESQEKKQQPLAVKPSIVKRIRDGISHYWHGSKLLVYETRVSTRLVFKLLRGEQLIRREYKQLVRTSSDLFRLVPFAVILIVPFLEFALPIILKLFPNFLPSTFEDKLSAEEKVKKQLKVKLEMAKFLQVAVENMAAEGVAPARSNAAREFSELFRKCRMTGEALTTDEVARVCQQLGEALTLDNLHRPQLVSLCRYMGINAFGTDNFLRFQIRKRMQWLHADDLMIEKEGIDSLTPEELRAACQMRGIRAVDVSEERMRQELFQWLELHLHKEIPAVMLILSRAFSIQENVQPEQALQATIMSLPEHLVDEVELQASETSGSRQISPKQKLLVLEQQQEMIADELAQEEKARDGASQTTTQLTREQAEDLTEAISVLSSDTPVQQERDNLKELKEDVAEYKENVIELQNITGNKLSMPKAAQVVESQVERLIADIESELVKFEQVIGNRLHLIQTNNEGQLTTGQLELIFKTIKNTPKDSKKIHELIRKLDKDSDGKVLVSEILKFSDEASQEEGQGVVLNEKS